jgi:hypothetical protein
MSRGRRSQLLSRGALDGADTVQPSRPSARVVARAGPHDGNAADRAAADRRASDPIGAARDAAVASAQAGASFATLPTRERIGASAP